MANATATHDSGFSSRTHRAETFQQIMGDIVRPALVRADRCGSYDFRVNHVRLDQLEVTVVSYGDPIDIDLPEGGQKGRESLVLQMMLAGSAVTYVDGGTAVEQLRSSGHLATSDLPMRVRCRRDCRHFLVRMNRGALERTASDLQEQIDMPDPRDSLSLASPAGSALKRYMRYLVAEIDMDGRREFLRYAARATQQSLLVHTLAALRASKGSPGGAERTTQRASGIPRCVERAEAFMEARLDLDIGIQDIVASSGTSLRTLYRGFERARGTTPMGYLRERRLERAHADLLASDPRKVRVTDVALRWGFPHLSDFALQYRRRFGCLPSQTLRKG